MGAAEIIKDFQQRAQLFAEIWARVGYPIKFHSYYRGEIEQNTLFEKGSTKARFGQSAHNYGLGVDYHFEHYGWNVPKDFWAFGDEIARYVGLESGVSYGDANHIQLPGWKNWKPYFLV